MNRHAVDYVLTTAVPQYEKFQLKRPVDPMVLEECIRIALRAPSSAHQQSWHFVVVTDPDKRATIAALYCKAVRSELGDLDRIPPSDFTTALSSIHYLVRHLHQFPLFVVPCTTWRAGADADTYMQADLYGSILPAVCILLLALRARGLGAAWTTWHLMYEREVAQLLQIPPNVTQALLLPVAHCPWNSAVADRHISATAVVSWNRWGARRKST